MYIGQSMNSAAHRFKQHCSTCMNPKSRDLKMYSVWRKHGIDNIYILPVEKVIFEQEWGQLDAASRKRMFQHRAFPLEDNWVRRLRTWAPHGYNIQFGGKQRKCRHAKRNPMKKMSQTKSACHAIAIIVVILQVEHMLTGIGREGYDI